MQAMEAMDLLELYIYANGNEATDYISSRRLNQLRHIIQTDYIKNQGSIHQLLIFLVIKHRKYKLIKKI